MSSQKKAVAEQFVKVKCQNNDEHISLVPNLEIVYITAFLGEPGIDEFHTVYFYLDKSSPYERKTLRVRLLEVRNFLFLEGVLAYKIAIGKWEGWVRPEEVIL
jgi:hypothetical protein